MEAGTSTSGGVGKVEGSVGDSASVDSSCSSSSKEMPQKLTTTIATRSRSLGASPLGAEGLKALTHEELLQTSETIDLSRPHDVNKIVRRRVVPVRLTRGEIACMMGSSVIGNLVLEDTLPSVRNSSKKIQSPSESSSCSSHHSKSTSLLDDEGNGDAYRCLGGFERKRRANTESSGSSLSEGSVEPRRLRPRATISAQPAAEGISKSGDEVVDIDMERLESHVEDAMAKMDLGGNGNIATASGETVAESTDDSTISSLCSIETEVVEDSGTSTDLLKVTLPLSSSELSVSIDRQDEGHDSGIASNELGNSAVDCGEITFAPLSVPLGSTVEIENTMAALAAASTIASIPPAIVVSNLYQPPVILCADNKMDCSLPGSPVFPCERCHREFYCSDKHRTDSRKRHEPDCRTKSDMFVHSIDKEYQMWLTHAVPTCYDVCLNFLLVWSSLTVQWLPSFKELEDGGDQYELLVGTYTSGDMNHLLVCGVEVPNKSSDEDDKPRAIRYEGSLSVKKRINHKGEIHRARYMPQNPNLIATKSPTAEVYLFDLDKYPDVPANTEFNPRLVLRGHTKEGFGLAWNPTQAGLLLSGSNDHAVCLWDTNHLDKNATFLDPLSTFKHHLSVVEDVDWHAENPHVAASVGDDKKLVLWDTRGSNGSGDCHVFSNDKAHSGEINSVKFSPFSENAIITGSSDKTVALWDMRKFNQKLHSFENHRDEVMQVQWSPNDSNLLASTGKDKRVFVWSIKNINMSTATTPTDAPMQMQFTDDDEAPPELFFVHGGHICPVNDISWNPHELGMMASVCEENTLQLWQIAREILFEECAESAGEEGDST